MNFIGKYKSPNFEKRRGYKYPDKVIIHYTGMKNTASAIKRLCSPESKVSSHYLINRRGRVWHLVSDSMASWHAGLSSWLGEENINHSSIGIELCNPGHELGYLSFTEKQMSSLEYLLFKLINEYKIRPESILGHSDIAPSRKKDPGEKFNWKRLANRGFALWPDNRLELPRNYNKTKLIQDALESIGYDVRNYFEESIVAFKRHFIPNNVSTKLQDEELKMLVSVSNCFNKKRTIS